MKCLRCPNDIEATAPTGVVICGSCADDLRQEEDASWTGDEAFWANKEAYEEAMHNDQMDTMGNYRYI